MEKIIELTMDETKTIIIKANGESFTINKDSRAINADDIYKLLDYKRGDKYIVKSFNEKKLDVPVLDFFTKLFEEIVEYLNMLSDNGVYTESEKEEVLNNQNNYTVPFDEDVPF